MMKLCVCVWFIALMCVPHWCNAGGINFLETGISMQTLRSDGEKCDTIRVADDLDKLDSREDTTWIINVYHSAIRNTFKTCLLIPKEHNEINDYSYVRVIQKMADSSTNTYSDYLEISDFTGIGWTKETIYTGGSHDLTVEYYNDKNGSADLTIKYRIFNEFLSGDITKTGGGGENNRPCINTEDEDKTFSFKMKSHKNNPPSTEYYLATMVLTASGIKDVWDTKSTGEDTASLTFTGPVGDYGVMVGFNIICDDERTGLRMFSSTPTSMKIYAYDKPDLEKIFDFSYEQTSEDIEVCTGDALPLVYDSLLNTTYMVSNEPNFGPPRVNYEVNYFRKDSINQTVWANVTDSSFVDDNKMIFNHPGYYKINIEAWNDCGRDTLKTDSIAVKSDSFVKGLKKERHILVLQNSAGKIRCATDVICGNKEKGDTIIFVDFGKRYAYDKIPEYEFKITHNDASYASGSVDTVYYHDGKVVKKNNDGFECDSTLLKVHINGPGLYKIEMTRSSSCVDTGIVFNHTVRVGDAPTSDAIGIGLDTFFKGVEGYDNYKQDFRGCDTYTLNISDNEIIIDSNYMKIDSILWICQQGENDKTRDTLFQTGQYTFDSTEVDSYILVQAKNKCGMGEQRLTVVRSLTPSYYLTRNGINGDKNVCINKFYKYNLEGEFPPSDNYTGTAMFEASFIQFEAPESGLNGISKGDRLELDKKGDDTCYVASLMYDSYYLGDERTFEETYNIENKTNKKCKKKITSKVYIWDGRMNVSGIDTIKNWPLSTHKIELKDGLGIDTNDIKGSIAWTSLTGGSFKNASQIEAEYTMSENDKKNDTVLLVLSGSSMCSETFKDTLIVIVPQPKLFSKNFTICKGGEQPLWGNGENQTQGQFIKEGTLKWEITEGGEFGSISGAGTDVKFKADKNNTTSGVVKIKITASQLYNSAADAVDVTKTIEVKVNVSPQHIFPDTLNVDASEGKRTITFSEIKNYKNASFTVGSANSEKIEWKLVEGEGSPLENGGIVSIGNPPSLGNYSTTLLVKYTAQEKCVDSLKYVIFMGIVPPIAKLEDIKHCENEGDTITLNNKNYNITAKDEYTKLVFSEPDSVIKKGEFIDTLYVIGENKPTMFIVSATKKFQSYKDEEVEFSDNDTAKVTVIGEPKFSLNDANGSPHSVTTNLCAVIDTFPYQRSWINHNGGVNGYDINDFETSRSVNLTGSFPKFTLKDSSTDAKLVIHLNVGNCKREQYDTISKTLIITRNSKTKGSFESVSICETEKHTIKILDTIPGQEYKWGELSSGAIDSSNNVFTPAPVSLDTDTDHVSITLKLKPEKGEGVCAWDEYTDFIVVQKQPTFNFKDGYICEDGEYEITYTDVDSIIWSTESNKIIDTTKGGKYTYTYNKDDVKDSKITLIAQIRPEGSCSGKFIKDTILLTVNKKFVVPTGLNVCQGDSLKVMINNTNSHHLFTVASAGTRYEDPYFYPNEYGTGTATLWISGEGLEGCGEIDETEIHIEVQETINPKFEAIGGCANKDVTYTVSKVLGGVYKWEIENTSGTSHEFNYKFSDADTADLKLTTTLGSCERSYTKEIITKALPNFEILMTPDDIIAEGQTVDFTVDLNDDKIKSYLWTFEGGTAVTPYKTTREQKHRYEKKTEVSKHEKVTLKIEGVNGCSATKDRKFKVVGKPTAIIDTIFDKCTGVIKLSARGEGTYSWSSEGIELSTDTIYKDTLAPTFQDTTYVIKLTVTNRVGSHDTTFNANVISKLASGFRYTRRGYDKCGDKIVFRNETKGDADSLTFVWNDEKDSTLFPESFNRDILYSYGNSTGHETTYKPYLIAHNACHNDTVEHDITIQPSAYSLNFEIAEGDHCKEHEISFKNTSKGLGTTAYWYFGDDDVVISADSVVTRRFEPGEYDVTLKMFNTFCNWSDIQTQKLTIGGSLVLDFDIEGEKCSEQKINFKVSTESKDIYGGYEWTFKKGVVVVTEQDTSEVSRSFKEGIYTAELKAYSSDSFNCPMEIKHQFTVENVQEAKITELGASDKRSCLPHIVSKFSCAKTKEYTKVEWDFGNEYTQTDVDTVFDVNYTTAGEYMVKLTTRTDNGCVDVDSVEITTLNTPKASFDLSDTLLCKKNNILKITNTTDEEDTYGYKWWYKPYMKDTIVFQAISSLPLKTRGWTRIGLKVTNNSTKCTNTYIDSVRIGSDVGLKWRDLAGSSTEHCGEDKEVTLDYSYTDGDVQDDRTHHYKSVDWGEGFVPNNSPIFLRFGSIEHTYDKETKNNVKLAIITQDGCRDTIEHNVNVYKQPTPFEVTMPRGAYCTGQGIDMYITPGDIKDGYTNFSWNFGNGESARGDSVTMEYLTSKEYSVTVTATSTSEGGCVSIHTEKIKPYTTPRADIYQKNESIEGCTPLTVETFSFGGNDSDNIDNIRWTFIDGEGSDLRTPINTIFKRAGKHMVLLSVTAQNRCIGRDTVFVTAEETPDVNFTFPDTAAFSCWGGVVDVELTNETSEPEKSKFDWYYALDSLDILSEYTYLWGVADPESHFKVNHLGDIRLKLVAENKETYCVDSLVKTIVSGRLVNLQAIIDTVLCYGDILKIGATTAEPENTIISTMGDGTSEIRRDTFTHDYDNPGEYEFKIVAENSFGCRDSLQHIIAVYPLPIADFYFEKGHSDFDEMGLPEGVDFDKLPDVENGVVIFTNSSNVEEYDFASSKLYSTWNFGDSTSSDLQDPKHRFHSNASYEIRLLVNTDYGCVDSTTQYVDIKAIKGLFMPNAFAPSAAGDNNKGIALFQPKGMGLLSYKIQVYDKTGATCVWSSDRLVEGKPADAWDGTFNGQPLPKDYYVWKASAIFIDGTVWNGKNGMINLIR